MHENINNHAVHLAECTFFGSMAPSDAVSELARVHGLTTARASEVLIDAYIDTDRRYRQKRPLLTIFV